MNGIRYFFILLLFLIPGALLSQTVVTYTTSGTFTVPCGVTSIQVECWGGGGGSGAGGASFGGSGGGGGAYASSTLTVTPGQTIPYTIGAAGTAGPTGGGVAGTGGSTSWNGSVVLAIGGGGGQSGGGAAGAGGLASSSVGTIKYSGCSGFMSFSTDGGGGGGSAGNTSNGNNATSLIGAVAVTGGGVGGDGQPLGTIGASPASGYGGGAGGAGKKQGAGKPGGAGAGGKIVVTYTQIPLAAGTYSIGPTGNYQTIAQSITAMCAGIAGAVVFELQPTYTDGSETYPITFTSVPGASSSNTITYRPQAGTTALVNDGDPGSGISLIVLNDVDYLTIDGRPGGTGTNIEWTFRNTRTAATVLSAIEFKNDATYNTVQYVRAEAESPGTGVVRFFNNAGTIGTDNCNLNHCIISDLTAGGTVAKPYAGVSCAGTITNDFVSIDDNQIVDAFNTSSTISAGIMLLTGASNFIISNNHIFQSAPYSNLITYTLSGIDIETGSGHTVAGNYIGGQSTFCGGSAYTISSGTSDFNGIKFGSSVTGSNTVSGNTIANIAYTTTATSAIYPFVGIALQGSANYTCGSAGNGNIIGSTSGTGSIVLTNNAASGSLGILGIYVNSTGINYIGYNSFGGLSLLGTRTNAESEFIILTSGNSTNTIDNNIFGNATANNILINTNSILYGIRNTLSNGVTINNNTFQNITHLASSQALGIIYNSAGVLNCSTNVFKNIRCASNINSWIIDHQPSVAANASVYNNIIQDISWENTGTSARFFGISLNSPSGGSQTCINNTIGSISSLNIQIAGNADSYAIYHSGTGTLTCTGNTIQEFNLSNSGTTGSFMAINCIGGTASVTWNTIKNLITSSSKAADVLNGINMNSSSTGHVVEKNKILNLISNSTTADTRINGITLYSGTGTLSRNFIKGNENKRPSTASSNFGVWLDAATWDIYNNIILLDNGSNVNEVKLYGIYDNTSTQAKKIHHNTIKLSGAASGGSTPTACLRKVSGSTATINNNIFQNIRTGGSAGNYSIYMASTGMNENYNYLEVTENVNKLAKYDALDKTFAAWQAAAGSVNSVTGTITINDTGLVVTDPFPGAGTGKNLTSIVPTDINGTTRAIASWMGAFEGQNITTSAISPASICKGNSINVSYSIGGGAFNPGNNFIAQLSDNAGSFASPVNIGSMAATSSGTINVTIPLGTLTGSNYFIRIVSTDPVVTGSDNGAALSIASPSGNSIPQTDGFENCFDWTTANAATNAWFQGTATNNGGTKSAYISNNGGTSNAYSVDTSSISHMYKTFSFGGGQSCVSLSFDYKSNGEASYDFLEVWIGASSLSAPTADASPSNQGYVKIGGPYNSISTFTAATIALNGLQGTSQRVIFTWTNDNSAGNQPPAAIDNINFIDNGAASPQTYFVTSTANGTTVDGVSLRWAITQANANCGHDTIKFSFGAGGPFTISLTAALPDITDNSGVHIEGFKNTGNNGTANTIPVFSATAGTPMNAVYKVILGNGGTVATGLKLASHNNVIKGLVMQDFGDGTPSANDIAITISGNNNQILGCIVGLDVTGTTRGTKTGNGINISGANNLIGDGTATGANIVSGTNTNGTGIIITGVSATGNSVKGNMIGLQKDGSTIVTGAFQGTGVQINSSASSNTIGGSVAGDGNVISGNNDGAGAGHGISLVSAAAGGNTVEGNIIGPQADGVTYVTSNMQFQGIEIFNSPNNTIGGITAASRNIISANEWVGVRINGASSTGNNVKGNYIGTDITGTLIISGSTQDYGVYIQSSASNNIIGGNVAGSGNLISGNKDAGTGGTGIFSSASVNPGNLIKGNIIGLQVDGISYLNSNQQFYGIHLSSSDNNIIGGNTVFERNIISANDTYGIYLTGAACSTNVIKGNYIGIDKNGITFITGSSQDYGIAFETTSSGANTIGGDATLNEGNVISGNTSGGIYSASTNAIGNNIFGNIIGPQADGISYLTSNVQGYGIYLSGSRNNTIGGNSIGFRNIISANEFAGLYLTGAACSTNVIKGNYIGIDKNGTTKIAGATQNNGIYVTGSASGNTIGGSWAGDGNVISGQDAGGSLSYGISLFTSAPDNVIQGNIIGLQADGLSYITTNKQDYGITIVSSANNIIGGSTSEERNIISGNESYGINVAGAASTGTIIKGNYIGLDISGTSFISGSTQDQGISIIGSSSGTTVGGSVAGEGNVISGNKDASNTGKGISISSAGATGNTIIGNIIGPQADGITYLTSNGQFKGIELNGTTNNSIGGNSVFERNVISANEQYGIYMTGAACSTNVIKGNYIGIDKNGTTFITGSTQDNGIYITTSAGGNTIGGDATTGEGNVISGNRTSGTTGRGIYTISTAGNTITGNIIGPQADGITLLSSNAQNTGIELSASSGNIIGGNNAASRNVISANQQYGIYLSGAACSTNVIRGNYIGLDATGTSFIAGSSQDYGVYITSSAGSNTIGGDATLGEGNVISGNSNGGGLGRGIFSNSVSGNIIRGNIIGPQSNGLTYVGSNDQNDGIYLDNTAGNSIGGSTVAYRNVISGNESTGIYMFGAACSTNTVTGNYIGSASDLSDMAGSNQDYGIYITSSAANNTIGTTTVGDGNTILHNSTGGIYVNGTGSVSNKISGNSIYENLGKPIDLNYGASQANSGKAVPVITQATSLTISGTAAASDIIEIYKNTSSDCYDATTFITSVTADGSGNWTASVNLSIGDYIMATAHDASNNTSEFSTCTLESPEFFWVGDGGDWTNFAAHWAKSSGGVTFWSVPPPSNSLIRFDSNSCGGLGHIINMDIDTQVKEIDFRDVNTTPTITGTGVITIGP